VISEVQLEIGSVATPFEQRPYGMELALCQRYYQTLSYGQSIGQFYSTTAARLCWSFPVAMRVAPTLSIPTLTAESVGTGLINFSGSSGLSTSVQALYFNAIGGTGGTSGQLAMHNSPASVSAEL
jgi:hypothetical protein